jgi:ABC-2 type transport system permease protein
MRILDLAFKDLTQIFRDRKTLFFLVVMPVIFTFFFGWVFGGIGGGDDSDPRLAVAVLDEDNSTVSAMLIEFINTSDSVRVVQGEDWTETSLDELVSEEQVAAAVLIPAGYEEGILAQEDVQLTLKVDPGSLAGSTAQRGVEAMVTRMMGAVAAAQISSDTFEQESGFATLAERENYLNEALLLAQDAWRDPAIQVVAESAVIQTEEDEAPDYNSFAQSSPGMLVQFAVFGLLNASMVLVIERKNGALHRLMTTPIRRAEIITGHVLAMFVMVFIQESILIGLGQWVFDLDYLSEPGATLLMMVVMALWASSLGLFIGTMARTEDQVITYALISMFLFSALGGAWFPLDITGETFSAIGHLMPTAWAMDGFQNIIIRGMGLNSVLLPVSIIAAWGIAFFGLAIWRFRFE